MGRVVGRVGGVSGAGNVVGLTSEGFTGVTGRTGRVGLVPAGGDTRGRCGGTGRTSAAKAPAVTSIPAATIRAKVLDMAVPLLAKALGYPGCYNLVKDQGVDLGGTRFLVACSKA